MVIKFEIPGPLFGKARPRKGKFSLYDPASNQEYEAKVREAYLQARGICDPTRSPVILQIEAYYPIPKSARRKRLEDKIKPGDIYIGKPDVDNIQKSVMDGLNNVAYVDDAQVFDARCIRRYADEPGVKVTLITLGGTENEY